MAKQINLSQEQITELAKVVGEEIMAQVSSSDTNDDDIDTIKKELEKIKKERDELAETLKKGKPADTKTEKTETIDPVREKMRKRIAGMFGK